MGKKKKKLTRRSQVVDIKDFNIGFGMLMRLQPHPRDRALPGLQFLDVLGRREAKHSLLRSWDSSILMLLLRRVSLQRASLS